jgi:hypothetical protein
MEEETSMTDEEFLPMMRKRKSSKRHPESIELLDDEAEEVH